jgi:hypothetical protein
VQYITTTYFYRQQKQDNPINSSVKFAQKYFAQILPNKNNINSMINIVPTIPLGAYPQSLLCGQVGITPSRTSMSITIKIVPNVMFISLLNR